jgi:peptidyl-prolyl cis-trans isomerase C
MPLLSANVLFCQAFSINDVWSPGKTAKLINGWYLRDDPAQPRWISFTGIIYPMSISLQKLILFIIGFSIVLLVACTKTTPIVTPAVTATVTTEVMVSPEPSPTSVQPTPTPIPLAAIINGEAITLAEYQAELARFQASIEITGTNLASESTTIVLNELIDQTLLAQAATQNGFVVDDALVQTRMTALEDQLGGTQALQDWMAAHGYSNDEFQQALKRSVGASWMRDQIISAIPETADEVHVRQILLRSAGEADDVYAQLQSGSNFEELAAEYDPLIKGELGWFPREYLGESSIDEAAFALQPGQYSTVIETDIGYHILYLIERDANHTLEPDARQVLQVNAVENWLNERRQQSEIEILLP